MSARVVPALREEHPPQPFGESPLVATKLERPRGGPGYLDRPRISALLDRGLDDATRLTLVAAPPGYGKTIAVGGWLAGCSVPVAWLTLDDGDNDPARFVRYLAAALRRVRPAPSEAPGPSLGPGSGFAPDIAGAALLETIAASDRPFVLGLDDYQTIVGEPVHALVRFLVAHGPPFCRVVIITREDPPLPLARLRAHGHLVELRAADLRCTLEESDAYLGGAGVSLTSEQLERLQARTEGWIAGLQLAALSLARAPDPAAAIDAFEHNQRFVLDYLADEVLARVDPDLRSFLVRTSVADRFTAELCTRLSGREDAAGLLDSTERSNLFVVALDDERRWYRYHGLFADYLRSRLGAAERRELDLRAAVWFGDAGLAREGIPHLLRAGALDEAARLIEREARGAFEAGELATLLRWFEALPPERIESSAELVSWRAWTLFETGQLAPAIDAARRRLAAVAEPGPAEGRLLILCALLETVTGPEAEPLARAGLELVGDDPLLRSSALGAIGLGRLGRGDLAGAVDALTESFTMARRLGPATAFAALTPLAQALNAAGRRGDAERLCRELILEYPGPTGQRPAMAWYVDAVLGLLLYEANDVSTARRLLDRSFEAASRMGGGARMTVAWALSALAMARRADGAAEAAYEALRVATADLRASGLALPIPVAETEARIRLLEGDLEAATRWAEAPPADAAPGSPLVGLYLLANDVTVARVRLAQHRPDAALTLLRPAEAAYRSSGKVADLISALVLEAAAEEARGDRAPALRRLREAVSLAAPGRYVRRLVEDGARLGRLLPLVRAVAPAFVDEVIADLGPVAPAARRGSPPTETAGVLLETLTGRELEVLRLLATGARNADIAGLLGVSVGTARWHVGNVLAKLGQPSRAKAVLRARQLGLV